MSGHLLVGVSHNEMRLGGEALVGLGFSLERMGEPQGERCPLCPQTSWDGQGCRDPGYSSVTWNLRSRE